MKLRIEVDIDPSEVDLAAELITTLRTLTDHIKVNVKGQNGQKDIPAKAAAYEIQAATPLAPAIPVAAAPVPPDFDQPTRSAAPSGRSIEHPLANGYAEPSQAATLNLAAIYEDCIARFEQAVDADDQLGQDEAVQQLRSALPTQMTTEDEKLCFSTFMTAFEEALWQHRSANGSYVVPLCHILPQLPGAVKEESKQHIITKVLRHLMIKRPVTADRTEFFAHAEAFAAMSQLKFVLIEGAVQTIIQLLSKEDTCSAAVTMLGKTVELCYSLLLENCEPRKLSVLRAALNEVKYEAFVYDKQYIMGCMHWNQPADGPPQIPNGHPAPAPAAAASPPMPAAGLLRLEPITSWTGYNAPVKGVVIDEARDQVVSTSQNGSLVLHSFDGRELSRIESKMHYSRDMDYSKEAGVVCLASVPHAPDAAQPMYAAYQVEAGKLRPRGTRLSSAKMLGPLRFLANSTSFVAAETTSSGKEVINIFDSATIRGTGLPATPTTSFQTTHNHITAVAAMPTSSRAFLSGDKHGQVHLWDLRMTEPAAILLPPHHGTGPVEPNVGVITCLEVVGGHFVLAGAYNQGINVWDLRQLETMKQLKPCSSIALDDDVVTRMARGPNPMQFAVAAVKSLHTAEIDADGQVAGKVLGEKASEKFYFDLKWSTGSGSPLLYAASQGNTLDIYRAI